MIGNPPVSEKLVAGTVAMRYAVDDHLSSPSSLTDASGAVTERLSYDAWGQRRNANGTDALCGSIASATTRGFTGHEMMDAVCLVNMNARLYDPAIGRFMSADSVVSDPANGQSFNRYAYVLGNPLRYTDPSGYANDDADRPIIKQKIDPFGGETVIVIADRFQALLEAVLGFAHQDLVNALGRNNGSNGGEQGDDGDDSDIETVVVTGHKPPPTLIGPVASPGGSDPNGKCIQTLVGIGNGFEDISKFTGDISLGLEVGGLVVAGAGVAFGAPIVGGGLALAAAGGAIGLYGAGGTQIIGGLFQGFGGAGFSNVTNGVLTAGTSFALSRAGTLVASGAQSASQRAASSFIKNSNIVGGGLFDAAVNAIDQLGPKQKSCTN